jgi:cyclic pyranopterin phosphate synthase
MLCDRHNRVISYLRISITERCNMRCVYCMPPEGVALSPSDHLLTLEEIANVARVGATLGLTKIRLTGGEPTVRRDLPHLIAMLRAIPEIQEIAMTTNAARLHLLAQPLKDAGLDRVNISLDTLRPARMLELTRRDLFSEVINGIEAARRVGLTPLKFNAVVMRGVNDDELPDLLHFAHESGAQMRFIEWMPMGTTRFEKGNRLVTTQEMLTRLSTRFDLVREDSDVHDPARGWVCQSSGARVAFISSMSDDFCGTCNRMRLTAEGGLRPCLHQDAEVNLRHVLRNHNSDEAVAQAFRDAAALKWRGHQMTNYVPLFSAKDMVLIGG